MSKVKGANDFKQDIYNKMTQIGYEQTFETFSNRNADPESAGKLYSMLLRKGIYDGDIDQFKEQFYGVKKKETTSANSAEESEVDYVGTAGVTATGSSIEKANSGFQFVREGQEFTQGKKETTLAQIRQMKTERPKSTIVQVQDDKGRPTLRYLEDHKEVVKKKANRIPDAQTLETLKASDAVLSYYENKPDYVDMVEERRARGWDNTYNEGKFVAEGIGQMQRDVRSAIDLKTKEIGKAVLSQYLNLNEALKKTPEDSPEFPALVADYQKFQQAHPDIQEYEGLVNRFWALDKKTKEASKDPNYKEYFEVKAKKEQAQENADLWEMTGQSGLTKTSVLPAASKEVFDLSTGLLRAGASLNRWFTGKKYGSLDAAVEWMERSLDPALNTVTATPSNRSKMIGQRYADVGSFRVLLEGDQVMGVVTREGGYQVRNQEKIDEVVKAFEQEKPEVKTQGVNLYTAHDVILGGTMQMVLGIGSAGLGAKIGKTGSIASNFGSKATTIATNSAGTYNKLYIAAIQELGPDNQKAAERYAGMAAISMSMLGTMINPLEQQLIGTATRTSIKALAKELSEGVAEQTAVRNATRMLLTASKTIFKEGVVEGATEAVVDDAIKLGINKTMLKDEANFDIDLPQDVLDNVAEETLGGLFGSVSASISPSQFQSEALINAYKSPNRAKIIAKLDKAAQKHYETVFAKADLNPGKPIMEIHKQELVKEKTGEDYVAPVTAVPTQETKEVAPPSVNLAATIASQLDLTPGQELTTAMGQKATVIGYDVDEDDEEASSYYKVRMNESGEETLISIADYNKRVFEEGVTQLQAEGMERPAAEFAITVAQNLRGSTSSIADQTQPTDQSPEVGNMISDPIEENVISEGYARDGITYTRQEPLPGVTGNTGKIEFSATRPQQEFRYKVVEADQIQPSHTNSGERNPLHFIPEAQPKERNDKAGMAASDAIAGNIDLNRVSEAPNPYTGAPVVNTRGEVVQGNNRAIGIKKHYQGNRAEYKAQLVAKAQALGIDPAQVEAMNAPVLVREVDVDDETAIELGNYDVKDLETGGIRRVDPVATSRRIPFEDKQKIASALLLDPEKTLRENIRDNFMKAVKLLVPAYISPTQYETIVSKNTNNITPKGIDDMTELVLHFLFDGGDIRLRQVFEGLPYALQQGIITSMPQLFSVPSSEAITEQLQNAMILLYEVRATNAASVDEYLGQSDMFDSAKVGRFSEIDIALAKLLADKTQKQVRLVFGEYARLTLGATDMFETRPGISKAEALSQMTGVPYSITPQDVINGTNSNVEPDVAGETGGSQTEGGANARLGEEGVPAQGDPTYRGGVQYTESKQVPPRLKGLYRVISNAQKAMSKFGDFKVYYYESSDDIRDAYNSVSTFKTNGGVNGFFNPSDSSIHIQVNADAASTTALHEILHPFVRAIKNGNPELFTQLHENLKTLPEYEAVTMTGSSVRQFSENPYYDFIGTTEEEALVEFFARVSSGELLLRKGSKGKLIEWINEILRTIGFPEIGERADVRKWAGAIAKSLQQGVELDRPAKVESDDVAARLAATPFPYYDRITKLVEIGINKGLGRNEIVQTIVNALSAEKITVDPAIIEAIHTSRTAIAKKQKPISNKYLAAFKAFHQKYFVAAGGGVIRDLVERLDGTIQRYVDHTQSLIALAEKQSKGIDQDLVDRFLRDENSAAEKSEIIDRLRILGFSEENIDQYMRRGTTRYQRTQMVTEFRALLPTIQLGLNVNGVTVDQAFIDNTLESFIDSSMSDEDRAKIPADLAGTLTTMRTQIDNLSGYLVDEGYVAGDRVEVIEQNLGQYMSDVYGIFKDKKFKPTEAAKAKARKYFAQQIRNDADKLAAIAATGNDIDEEILKLAAREVEDYIVKSQQGQSQGVGAPVGKKSEAIFKKKEGVPDELKELLGKYEPLQEYAYTMYQLVNYVEKSKFQRSLTDLGDGLFMWNRNDPSRPVDANYQLRGFASGKLSGDANPFKGMYVTREVFEVLEGLDQTLSKFDGIMKPFLKFQGWVNKLKTVYSYQTHFGNVIGNFFFMAFNGMADKQTFTSLATAAKSTTRDFWGGYGLKQDEVDEALTVLKNEGVIGNNISVMAIRETVGSLDKERAQGLPAKGQNALAWGDKRLTDLYQAEDSFFKILAYLTERKRYGQALYGKAYETLSPIERAEVNKIATDIAKANWPNYNRMGRLAQSIAKNNVVFGNFLPFTFEAIRTFGNTVALAKREIQSTNPGVRGIGRKRMAGIVAGSLAADAAMIGASKIVGGVFALFFSGEDDTKLNRDLRIGVPKFLKGGDLMFTKVGPGVYQCIDISAKNPMAIFRRHFNAIAYTPSDEEMATAISKQFLESFFSETIAMKYVDSIRSNDNGKGDKIWRSTDSGAERAEKIFEFTMKAVGPASITSAQKVINAEDPAITLRNQVFGMNTYELDFVKVWGKKLNEYNGFGEGVLSELRKDLNKIGRDQDTSEKEYDQALKEFHAKRRVELDRLIEIRKSMLNVGLTELQIDEVMKDARIGKEDQIYLNGGEFIEKYIPRKD